MKIIQVSPRFISHKEIKTGGIEAHVYEIAKRLAKKHDVYVFTTDPTGKLKKEEIIEGMKIVRFKSFAPNEAYFFSSEIYFALKEETCDILHVHSFQAVPSFLAHLATNKSNVKKFIFTPHYHPFASTPLRNLIRKFYDPIQKKTFERADKIICVSNHEKNLLHKNFDIPLKKMIKIPNGINVDEYKHLPKVKKEHEFQILYHGRLEKYKRVEWILSALKKIKSRFPEKDIHLSIVGKGPYENNLKKACKELEIMKYVTFKKNVTDEERAKEYVKCDVFVMPSEYEAFSLATLQALAFKKPVIVSNVGGLPELVENNGFIINSEEDLERSLLKALEKPLKVSFNLKKYSWDTIIDEISNVYET